LEYYELVVGAKALALFISSQMDEVEIRTNVHEMVDKALKYRLDHFRIHAKGKGNIDCLKNFINSQKSEDVHTYMVKKVYEEPSIPAIEYVIQPTRS